MDVVFLVLQGKQCHHFGALTEKSRLCEFRISVFQARGDSWLNPSGPAGFRVCRPNQDYEVQVLKALGTKPLNE